MGRNSRIKNSKYLSFLARNATANVKDKVANLISLYSDAKISHLTTVGNLLFKLISRDQRTQKSGIKAYDKTIDKFKQQLPLNQRLEAKQNVRLHSIKKNRAAHKFVKLMQKMLSSM